MRVLVFGASVTQGFWDSEGGWVNRLRKHYDQKQLKDLKHNDEPTIFNLGISGDTSAELLKRMENEIQARLPRDRSVTIVVSIGLNDSYREGSSNFRFTPENYADNLQGIISIAKRFTDKILFVGLSANDDSKTNPVFWRDIYYSSERIRTFNNVMQQTAEVNNLKFVPLFDEFKKHLDVGEEILADGLHPSDTGHKLIADLVKPELENLLN